MSKEKFNHKDRNNTYDDSPSDLYGDISYNDVEEKGYDDHSKDTYQEDMKEDAKKKVLEALKNTNLTIVNAEHLAEMEARDAADAHMTESKGKAGFFRKLWKHTFMDEFYRQRELSRVRNEIKNSGNIYTRIEQDKNAHNGAMEAITTRFASEYEEAVNKTAGEDRDKLKNTDPKALQAKAEVKKLITDYANGLIDEEVFNSEKIRIFGILDHNLLKGASTYADNLFEIAKNVKLAIEHGVKLDELDLDFDITVGKAKSSIKTEAKHNFVDKGTDWLKKSKVGRYVSPTLIATSLGVAYSAGVFLSKSVIRNKFTHALTFGGSAVASGLIAAANESQRLAEERRQHGREMAKGGVIDGDSKRRESMEKYAYATESAVALMAGLRDSLFIKDENGKEIPKEIDETDYAMIMAQITNIEARNALADRKKIDLISYSNPANVEKERTELTILLARSKVELRKQVEGRLASVLPINLKTGKRSELNEIIKLQTEEACKVFLEGDEGIDARDRSFSNLKFRRSLMKAGEAVAIGLTVGVVTQEIIAGVDGLWGGDREGVVEGLIHRIKGGDTSDQIQTPLDRLIFGDTYHLSGNLQDHVPDGVHHIKLPEGTNIIQNADKTFSIMHGDKVVSDHIELKFTPSGELDPESIKRLGEDGIVANSESIKVGSKEEITSTPKEYIDKHPDKTTHIKRDLWYGNDTPMHLDPHGSGKLLGADYNEIKTQWGGEHGTGIDAKGDYVFNISKMTSDGSWQTLDHRMSVDAREKIANGGLKMLLSFSKDTQNYVIEATFDVHGNATFDHNDPMIKQLFSVDDKGHAVFNGKFAEVAETLGKGKEDGLEHVKLLGTHVGRGLNSVTHVVDSIKNNVGNNIMDIPIHMDTERPYFIPVFARTPLEPLSYKKKEAGIVVGGVYNESYLDRDSLYEDPIYSETPLDVSYDDQDTYDEKNIEVSGKERLNPKEVEKNIAEMEEYLKNSVDLEMMKKLDEQIGEPMDNNARISVVLPCYKEGKNIYKTLSDWTLEQKDLKPEELEIIVFVNAPKKEQELDSETISEIARFQSEHPDYKIKMVKHNFDFKTNRKMGAIYKAPADLAIYRNMKRLEAAASKEIVSAHLMRCGGADALGRNPRFLREIIDFMDNHPETEQLRTQSAYPPEVREKFPLFNLVTVFNHSLSLLYTRGDTNIGLGTFRARVYAEAAGFDSSREYREEIDLGMRIRNKVGRKKGAINKLVKKNAIDNPRRELFALARGETVLRAYTGFSEPERDIALRDFDWDKKLSSSHQKNIELNLENMNREFDAYFQHYLVKITKESGIISQVLNGEITEESVKSSRFHPEVRLLLRDPEVIDIIKIIGEERKSGKKITRANREVRRLAERMTKKFFDRTLLLSLGLKAGASEDYEYEELADKNLHLVFKPQALTKMSELSKKKWESFDGYWKEKPVKEKKKTKKTSKSEKVEIDEDKEEVEDIEEKEKLETMLINKSEIESELTKDLRPIFKAEGAELDGPVVITSKDNKFNLQVNIKKSVAILGTYKFSVNLVIANDTTFLKYESHSYEGDGTAIGVAKGKIDPEIGKILPKVYGIVQEKHLKDKSDKSLRNLQIEGDNLVATLGEIIKE